MVRFAKKKGDDDASDSVSELSNDDSSVHSHHSKSSAFRAKFGKFGRSRKRGSGGDGNASVGSASKQSAARSRATNGNSKATAATAAPSSPGGGRSVDGARSVGSASRRSAPQTAQNDEKRLRKDAKSRFNIGLVYLKTGDHAKAQDNLEHSLYCHIQLHGHDAKAYNNEALFAVAGVREKLGECYLANSAIVDKCLALDHYEEARRLLRTVDPEDAPDNVKEMLERVEETLKTPELCNMERRRPPPISGKYQMKGNDKAKALLGVGAAGAAAGAAAAAGAKSTPTRTAGRAREPVRKSGGTILGDIDVLGLGAGFKAIGNHIKEGIQDLVETSSEGDESSAKRSHAGDPDGFDTATAHLERGNARTAFNYLLSLKEGDAMQDAAFRSKMALHMLKIGDSAMDGNKVSVATDAYEEAYGILQNDDPSGENTRLARRGCVKGHKKLALATETMRDYGSAIQHRNRVYQIFDERGMCPQACHQLLRIAYLHGEKDDYAKSAVVLSDAIRRLFKGVKSLDLMPADRMDLLIQCYHMRSICYAKTQKWNEALKQYDELLPLVAKKEGQGSKQYNSALIHKAALLVTMGNHRLAAAKIDEYLKLADINSAMDGSIIVDDLDHLLALDTCAATHLKLGNVDKAIEVFQQKLKFVKTLPDNDEMKSDTMHKLGCLLAYKQQHDSALPLLNEALNTRKVLYNGKHRSVFESTWAVAATNQTLGDTDRALKDYAVLLEKMNQIDNSPIDSTIIHCSAGRLFFEDGKVDKAVSSFKQALQGAESLGNNELKAQISLNLANALSAQGDSDKAMDLYDSLLKKKSLKKTKLFFLIAYDKSLLLVKLGDVDEARELLNKVADSRSSGANEVRGSIYLTLGNLAVSEGKFKEALDYYDQSLEVIEEDDIEAVAQVKKQVGLAFLESRQVDKAIFTFEDVLEDLSQPGVEGKSVDLLKAEVWNCLSRAYKKKGDLSQAKNYAKLALRTYKSALGESNPITLRNVSNLQLLLLEDAEGLQKSEAKPIIDAAKYEIEATLDAFVELNDPWTYRLDVASLKTNLGFVAVWQGKPKKARKMLRQIEEIELPPDSSLVQRITVLEQRVVELEKKSRK